MAPPSNNFPETRIKKPGFYYGYYVVISTFTIILMGWGIFSIYGVFFSPLSNEFSWSRAVTSGAYSLAVGRGI